MTKGNDKFIQQAINEVGVKVKNGYSGYIDAYELYGTTVKINLFNSDSKQYVHVFYNGIEAEKEKIQINKRYANMDAKLDDLKSKKIKRKEDVSFYEAYYRLKYDANGYFIAHQRKNDKLEELINKAGYFCIVTSKEMTAEEALEIYRDRDAIEKN